jgi:hypothetical protein
MTTQEVAGGLKTNVLRKPTIAELEATRDNFLEAEDGSVVNQVGKRAFQ